MYFHCPSDSAFLGSLIFVHQIQEAYNILYIKINNCSEECGLASWCTIFMMITVTFLHTQMGASSPSSILNSFRHNVIISFGHSSNCVWSLQVVAFHPQPLQTSSLPPNTCLAFLEAHPPLFCSSPSVMLLRSVDHCFDYS